MCVWQNGITRWEAFILMTLFVLFIVYTVLITRRLQKKEELSHTLKEIPKYGMAKSIFLVLIGIAALKLGGDLTVNHATNVARLLGLSEKLISITILAIGTSLPELVTGVVAAIKGNSDIAVGNIIGSNIFNILLIVGISAFIKPIIFHSTFNWDIIVLLFSTLLLAIFPIIPPKDKVGRREGFLYVCLYALYIAMSIRV